MATTRKTTGSSRASGGKRAASSRSSSSRSSGQNRKTSGRKPQPKPVRREVGSVMCLLLAVLTVLGGIGVNAIFLDFFCGLLKGLFGYGFWAVPVVLIGASGILLFHRGRPVRLRVGCALALPLLAGAFLHLFLCKSTYEGLALPALAAQLMREGGALQSGGTISGLLAIGFTRVFSKVGAALIFGVVFAALLLAAASVSIVDLVDWYRSRPRPEYEYEEEPEPVPVKGGRREARPAAADRRRKAVIDIPVDDGPAAEPEPPKAPPRKERLFDKQPRVIRPDELFQGRAEPAPEPEEPKPAPVPEPAPEPVLERVKPEEPDALPFDFPEQAKTALEEPVVPPEARNPIPIGKRELPEPVEEAEPVPDPLPPMPEIVREPAVPKRSKSEEAAAAAEEIAQSIEEGMSQDALAYRYPPLSLLKERSSAVGDVSGELRATQERLEDTLSSFGINACIIGAVRGPSATRYELELERGVKLSKVTNLAGDIALSLGANAVIIAPIPQRSSVLGIEVPNQTVTPVSLREVLDSPEFRNHSSKVAFAVGKDITNRCVVGNIAKLPHMLIAGTTGSGKSVCTNSLVLSLLYKATPEEVRLIIIDPKVVEFSVYNGIPHMLIPVVTDPKKAAGALQWAVTEMLKRYQTFAEVGVRDLASYNELAARSEDRSRMPQIVIIIDELADLMTAAAKEVDESICRVAQMGRASGMHLIIATQRPSADVITGLMKSNIPSRIGLKVDGAINSRIILDDVGAEKLLGYGDMLFKPVDAQNPRRVQGCFVDDDEVHAVVNFIKQQGGEANYSNDVIKEIEQNVQAREKGAKGSASAAEPTMEDDADEMLPAAIDVVVETGMASVSMLQRRLKLGYSRAARLVDQMQDRGIVGPFEGSKPRQVLITKEQWAAQKMGSVDLGSVPEELPYEDDAVEQGPPPFDP